MGYLRLKGYKDDQGLQEVTEGHRRLQVARRNSLGYRRLQGVTGSYKGLRRGYSNYYFII